MVRLLFYAVSATKAYITAPHLVAIYDTLGIRRTFSRLKPQASPRGYGVGSSSVGTTSSLARLHICTVTYMTEILLHVT